MAMIRFFVVGTDRYFHNGIFLLSGMAWLGCVSAGVFNSYLLYCLPFFFFYFFRNVRYEPEPIDLYTVGVGFFVLVLFIPLKFLSLQSQSLNEVVCSHADDFYYIQNTILIEKFRLEASLGNLSEVLLGIPYSYSLYHYFEFYITIFFHLFIPDTVYKIYHFSLWPVIHVFGVVFLYAFLKQSVGMKPILIALSTLVLFLTLRYVFADEALFAWLGISDQHISFFKNYSNSHTMSFWAGMKNSLALICLLPVVAYARSGAWLRAGIFACMAILVTVIAAPVAVAIPVLGFVQKERPNWLRLAAFSLLAVAVGFGFGFQSNVISLTNQIFENYYWTHLPFAVLVLLHKPGQPMSWLLYLSLVLFPFIFIQHQWGFKIFLFALIVSIGTNWRKVVNLHYLFVYSAFLAVYILQLILRPINFEFGQIYFNYFFILVVVLFSETIISRLRRFQNSYFVPFFLVTYLFLISIPPLFYDNKIPNHTEKVSTEGLVNGQQKIAVSIAEFVHAPYLFQDVLGDHLLATTNDFIICHGGFEFLSLVQRSELQKLNRVSKTNYFFNQAVNISGPQFYYDLIRNGKINCLLIENKGIFAGYRSYFKSKAKRVQFEPLRNYFIYFF